MAPSFGGSTDTGQPTWSPRPRIRLEIMVRSHPRWHAMRRSASSPRRQELGTVCEPARVAIGWFTMLRPCERGLGAAGRDSGSCVVDRGRTAPTELHQPRPCELLGSSMGRRREPASAPAAPPKVGPQLSARPSRRHDRRAVQFYGLASFHEMGPASEKRLRARHPCST
jgi:hypothetical protein